MTKTKSSRSILRDLIFLALLIAPLAGAAVFLWGMKVKDQLAALRQSHTLAHKAVEGFIERDIDDLETQLQNSVEKGTFLTGDFRFRKEGNALKATHTSRPKQPLSIALEGDMAFSKPLNQFQGQPFVLVTAEGDIISHSKEARKEAFGTVADPKILRAEPSRALALSDFDRTSVKPLSTSLFLFEKPNYLFTRTAVAKSNLVLFSYHDLRPLWKQATSTLFLIFCAAFAALMFGVGAIFALRSRQARNHALVHDVLESLRFGRLDSGLSKAAHHADNSEFYAKVQESLGKNTSLRRFLETEWIDVSKSSVSWNFFKHSIAHWSEGLSTESTAAPSRWFLGSCKVRSPEHVENFQRAFTRVFGKRTVRIYQSAENEFSFALRDLDVATCLARLKQVLRSTSDSAHLSTSDVSMSVFLVSETIPGKSLDAFAATQQRARENFARGLHLLIENCVELRHYQTGTELSVFGLSEALAEEESKEDGASTETPSTVEEETSPTSFPKRAPIAKKTEKKRPSLPPPPTLKTKNMRAGRGFIRITDALGKSEWVEISSKGGAKALETKEIAE